MSDLYENHIVGFPTMRLICLPQSLYNTIVWFQENFCVRYPICAIMRVKCTVKLQKIHVVSNDHLRSNNDQCYIQNHVVINHVIKRSVCI